MMLLLFGPGCANQRPVACPDFSVLLGSGGGFTGRSGGYRIEPDGAVWSWTGIGAPMDSSLVGSLAADSLESLARAIDAANFYADSTNEYGNITAFLQVTCGDVSHRVNWIPTVEQIEPPKSPTEAAFRRARTMAESVERE